MTGEPIDFTAWFGGEPMNGLRLDGTDKVLYSWVTIGGIPDEPRTIDHLMVWHDCDRSVWLANPEANPDIARAAAGFTPANTSLHTFVSADPLHIEPSLLWPGCCGMHGFIREGRWIPA